MQIASRDIATQSESPSDNAASAIYEQTECIFQNSFDVNGEESIIGRGGINSEKGTITRM